MSERLTHSDRSAGPSWIRLVPPALLLITALVLVRFHAAAPTVIPDEAHALYQLLPDPRWLFPLQAAFLVLLCLGAGLLFHRLVPPKTAPATRALAVCLGIAAAPPLLVESFVDAFSAQPALPSLATLVFGWWLFLVSGAPARRLLAAPAGLLAGWALCLDPLALAGVIPVAVWLLAALVKAGKAGATRLALWLVGLGVGLLPVLTGRVGFELGLSAAAHPEHLRTLFAGQGFLALWSIPFVLLALLAGALQRQPVLLGLILPTFALQLLGWMFQPLLIPEQAAAVLVPWTWLTAYGLFRLLRGVEQGVRNVNARRAKSVPLFFLLLTLVAYAAWAAWLTLPTRI